MDQIDRVDFSRSSLYWTGPSKGIFKLVALMSRQEGQVEHDLYTYGLGQAVMAGNMYVDNHLLKQPPYLFQVAGSSKEQRIFRSFLPKRSKLRLPDWKHNLTEDTHGEPLFKEFILDITQEPAVRLNSFEEIDTAFLSNRFSAQVTFSLNDQSIVLEFPINHMNLKHETRQWQVETGPILLPDLKENIIPFDYLPGFVHFNHFDKIDLFYDYPFGYRSV
ncbi:MAG: hypothetical protein QF675_05460, partial [SAR324 cluster bacterium]|nr:hypothetical protein [SAR324 cluster bacterium]